jgi:hypothetical protein
VIPILDFPAPSFRHLLALSDGTGTFEHADGTEPRLEHGYCTDDVARVLIVACREPQPSDAVHNLGERSLRFLLDAQHDDGRIRNRRTARRRWRGRHGTEDCWGRAVWAFGTAALRTQSASTRRAALAAFERSAAQRSPWPRAMTFAALGAAEVLAADPEHSQATALLSDAVLAIGPLGDREWPWPEPRLSYANAAVPEALIAAGHLLDRPHVLEDGLHLLGWLLTRETSGGHLSPTPAGGSGPDGDVRFDQQPIEVAAMADACARALDVTGDQRWADGLAMSIAWFGGANDVMAPMWDLASGGGYDGLHERGPNCNQGAESTLALVATLQHARTITTAVT